MISNGAINRLPMWVRGARCYSLASLVFAAGYLLFYVVLSPSRQLSAYAYPTIVLLMPIVTFLSDPWLYSDLRGAWRTALMLALTGLGQLLGIGLFALLSFLVLLATYEIVRGVDAEVVLGFLRLVFVFIVGAGLPFLARIEKYVKPKAFVLLAASSGFILAAIFASLGLNDIVEGLLFAQNTNLGAVNWTGQLFWMPIIIIIPGCVFGNYLVAYLRQLKNPKTTPVRGGSNNRDKGEKWIQGR